MFLSIFYFFSFAHSLRQPKSNGVFKKHNSKQMKMFFKELQEYSYIKSSSSKTNLKYSDSDMYLVMSKSLLEGIEYIDSMNDNAMYLGWIPFNPIKHTTTFKNMGVNVIRNDNSAENDFTEIPLYFICMENSEEGINISRIYHNPSIIVEIDVKIMMKHLKEIGRISNITMNFENLKYAHNGRWNLELIDFPTLKFDKDDFP